MTGWDVTLLRILLIVGTVFTSGALMFVYLVAGFVVPKSPEPAHGYGAVGYPGSGQQWQPQYSPYGANHAAQPSQPSHSASDMDAMMAAMETRALRKELEEMRFKIAKFEKGEV